MQVEIKQTNRYALFLDATYRSRAAAGRARPMRHSHGPCACQGHAACDAEHTLYTSKSQSSLTQSAWPGAPDTRHTGRGARPRPTTQAAAGADEAVMEYRMYHSTPLNGIMTSESGKGVSKPHESCT